MKSLLFIFGTRPETIKLAPVILLAKSMPEKFKVKVVVTGQHREMLAQTLDVFGITPDCNLDLMDPGQDLFSITQKAIAGLKPALSAGHYDWVIVQGDTTTAFVGALAAFYLKIPVAHVEAGLRTGDIYNPFPEEMNRRLIGRIAEFHFAPTTGARENLKQENVEERRIQVTGNTSIDALHWVLKYSQDQLEEHLPEALRRDPAARMILVTTHRRENFGLPISNVMNALRKIAEAFPDVYLFFPVHLNPNVRKIAMERLGGIDNVMLCEPLPYIPFIQAMKRCHLILTDSGGIQEEAPSLAKPVLVLRENTERPEGISAGTAAIVGTDPERIFKAVEKLLFDEGVYNRMSHAKNPYGEGRAAEQILHTLAKDRDEGVA
jgi:UDP-N-acetylglucosamine 2-epimerase (non-hydrolysing)